MRKSSLINDNIVTVEIMTSSVFSSSIFIFLLFIVALMSLLSRDHHLFEQSLSVRSISTPASMTALRATRNLEGGVVPNLNNHTCELKQFN